MRYKTVCGVLIVLLCLDGRAQSIDTLTVHFASDESALRPEDRTTLDRWYTASALRVISIQLIGYCDDAGGNKYNDSLSRQRVAAVKQYLRGKGIADTLFKVLIAYGKRKPLNDNSDEEKRSLNRRVTLLWQLRPASPELAEAMKDTSGMVGKTIRLNILFYGSMHRPMPVAVPVLQQLVATMKEHPRMKIEIQGHVCCVPAGGDGRDDETRTADLSVGRARYIYTYLAGRGIDTSRMTYKGFGASRKIYPLERNDAEMQANRRVEIKILAW